MTFNQLTELVLAELYETTQRSGHGQYYSLDQIASAGFGEGDKAKMMQVGQHLESQGLVRAIIQSGPTTDAQLTPSGIQYVEEGGRTGLIPLYRQAIKEGSLARFLEEFRAGLVEERIGAAAQERDLAKQKQTTADARPIRKLFLSHKGADKPLVRRFFTILKAIGFDPWLDEDAMAAGTELERGILQGFKDSCAAVFFITPSFHDEGYLRTEVIYAMGEKRGKGERFSIVTIVFTDDHGRKGTVPELLKQFVWKEPATELEAVVEILRALPIVPGELRWRT